LVRAKPWHKDCRAYTQTTQVGKLLEEQAMKNPKATRIQTTLGELIAVLCEETQTLFNFRGNEKPLVVAYILNDLVKKSVAVRHRTWPKKHS
jgi:hypothetical protein